MKDGKQQVSNLYYNDERWQTTRIKFVLQWWKMANNMYQICTTMMKDGKQHVSNLYYNDERWQTTCINLYYNDERWQTTRIKSVLQRWKMANNTYQICTTMMKDGKQHVSNLYYNDERWQTTWIKSVLFTAHGTKKGRRRGLLMGIMKVPSRSAVREQACMCGRSEESSLGALTNNLQSLKTS